MRSACERQGKVGEHKTDRLRVILEGMNMITILCIQPSFGLNIQIFVKREYDTD